MVGVHADQGIEIFLGKGQGVGVPVEGHDGVPQPRRQKPLVIFRRLDPKVQRKYPGLTHLGQVHGGDPPAAAQIQHPRPRGDRLLGQQLLQHPQGVGAHAVFP